MNQRTISTWAKKNFIYWFLENNNCSSEIPRKTLLYLLEKNESLSFLHIIENGALYRPLLVIASTGTGMPSCLLLTGNEKISEPEQILKYLDNAEKADLYLTFYFPGRLQSQAFQNVLEEISLEIEQEKAQALLFDFEIMLMQEEDKKEQRRREILAEIDRVLASGEKGKFQRLVKELKKI